MSAKQDTYIFKIEQMDRTRTIYRIRATRDEAWAQFEMEEAKRDHPEVSIEVYKGSSCYPPASPVFSAGPPINEPGR